MALALVSSPAMAQRPSGMDQARVGSSVKGENFRGSTTVPIIVALAALFAAIILATGGGQEPLSP
jgi:hypothetical protein